jgi:hypothetical protein
MAARLAVHGKAHSEAPTSGGSTRMPRCLQVSM